MALKDIWKDKVNGVDDVVAEDINAIAQSVIECEEGIEIADDKIIKLEEDMTETNVKVNGIQEEVSDKIGDIDTALEGIIAIQNSLIGGEQ